MARKVSNLKFLQNFRHCSGSPSIEIKTCCSNIFLNILYTADTHVMKSRDFEVKHYVCVHHVHVIKSHTSENAVAELFFVWNCVSPT